MHPREVLSSILSIGDYSQFIVLIYGHSPLDGPLDIVGQRPVFNESCSTLYTLYNTRYIHIPFLLNYY